CRTTCCPARAWIASSIILAIPVVGSYLSFFVFGGQFSGEIFISPLFTILVLLLPGIFLALISVHLILLVVQKHTQFPGPGRTNDNVVGYPLYPVYTAKAGGFFFIVFGVTALMGALFTINPVWMYGSYDPSPVTAGSQPDWYMGWLDGAVRLTPGFFEFTLLGFTFSFNIIIPALIIPGLVTLPMILYPWIEQWVTGDRREHHLLDRPRNVPTRTGLGVGMIMFYGVLWLNSGNDLIATHFHSSINTITWVCRVLVLIGPVIAFWIARRWALSLQRADYERLTHGLETGVIVRSPDGGYSEKH